MKTNTSIFSNEKYKNDVQRLYAMRPTVKEQYYPRNLIVTVARAISFSSIRAVNREVHIAYQEGCSPQSFSSHYAERKRALTEYILKFLPAAQRAVRNDLCALQTFQFQQHF